MMTQYLVKMSRSYNKDKYRSFAHCGAERRFLQPLGLTRDNHAFDARSSEEFTGDDEILHFQALHFVKYQLKKAIETRKPWRVRKWKRIYLLLRNRIIQANFGLIGKCVKITSIRLDYETLLSDGYASLIRASELFDPWRKFKFSTYACTSILRSFARLLQNKSVPAETCPDPGLLISTETARDDSPLLIERLRAVVNKNSTILTDREVEILRCRFDLGGKKGKTMTLEDVGLDQQISKERVRQVQQTAIKKLKTVLDSDPLFD